MSPFKSAVVQGNAHRVHPTSSVLFSLIKSLDDGQQFDLTQLYQLNYHDFALALDSMKQWRLDSFCYERGWISKLASEPASTLEYPLWSGTSRRLS